MGNEVGSGGYGKVTVQTTFTAFLIVVLFFFCLYNLLQSHIITHHSWQVYRGMLVDGQAVAIKRAQQGSMQGGLEFKTEIELLSRVHHKNLLGLVGFCFEQGEQMLVYEFMPNGTLRDSLSGKFLRTFWDV